MAIRRPEYAKLNKLINKYDFGWKGRKGIVRPTKDRWLAAMAAPPGEKHRFVYPLNNQDLLDHEEERDTIYYTPSTINQGLWGVDIDCHRSGTAEGAKQARAIVEQWLPGIYTEISTNGVGGHGHAIVDYGDWAAADIKPLWKNLCKALDKKCQTLSVDIQEIEAKGLPSNVVKVGKGISDSSTMGTLIRLPRNIKAAMATCVLAPLDIIRITDEIEASIPVTKKVIESSGCSNLICERDDIDRLVGFGRKALYAYNPTVILSNRVRVTVEDVAVALWIVRFCKKHSNSAGHTPGNRIRAIWNLLREQGITQRAFDLKRWAWIRNMLSDFGYIAWEDASYAPGKAMVWEITDQLEDVLDGLIVSSSTGKEQDFSLPPITRGQRPINRWISTFNWLDHAEQLELMGLGSFFIAV